MRLYLAQVFKEGDFSVCDNKDQYVIDSLQQSRGECSSVQERPFDLKSEQQRKSILFKTGFMLSLVNLAKSGFVDLQGIIQGSSVFSGLCPRDEME